MRYVINVDLERTNKYRGKTGCDSADHRDFGAHFDLTVHDMNKGCRNSRSVQRPPTRYWDDNRGNGYSVEKLKERLQALESSTDGIFSRVCGRCGVASDVLK